MEMTADEKQALVDQANRLHGTSVPVEAIELAITHGLTSWERLRAEVTERMIIYIVEGFGIPGDRAFVEAATPEDAKRTVKKHLDDQQIDYNATISAWEAKPMERPVFILRWKS